MGISPQTHSPRKSPTSRPTSTHVSSPAIRGDTESTSSGIANTPRRGHRRASSAGGVLSTPQRVLRNNLLQKSLSRSRESSLGFRPVSPTPSLSTSQNQSPITFSDLRINSSSSFSRNVANKNKGDIEMTSATPQANSPVRQTFDANSNATEMAQYTCTFVTQGDQEPVTSPTNRDSQGPAKKRRKGSHELDEPDYEVGLEANKQRHAEGDEPPDGEDRPKTVSPARENKEQGRTRRTISPVFPKRTSSMANRLHQTHEQSPDVVDSPATAAAETAFPRLTKVEGNYDESEGLEPTQKDPDDEPNWEIINDEDIVEAPPSRGSEQAPSRPGSASSPKRGSGGGSLKQRASLRKVITGRVSKFKEGSMNDRVSTRPPEELLLNYIDSQSSQSSAMMPTYRSTQKADRKSSNPTTGVNSVLSLSNRQGQGGTFYNSKGQLITGEEEFTLTGLLGSILQGKTFNYCRDNWWGPARKKYHDRILMNERKERAAVAYAAMKEKKKREEGGEDLTTIGRAVTTSAREKVELENLRGLEATGGERENGPTARGESLTGSHKRKYSQLTKPATVPSFQFNDFGGQVPRDYSLSFDGNNGDNFEDQEERTSRCSASHAGSVSASGSFSASGDGSAQEDNHDNSRLAIRGMSRSSKEKGKQKEPSDGGSASGPGSSLTNLKTRASKILFGSKDKDKDRDKSSQYTQPSTIEGENNETQITQSQAFSFTSSIVVPPPPPPPPPRQLSKRELAKAERLRKKVSTLEMKLLETWKELEAMGQVTTEGLLSTSSPPPRQTASLNGNGNGNGYGYGYGYGYGSIPSSPRLSTSSDYLKGRGSQHGGTTPVSRSTISLIKQEPGVSIGPSMGRIGEEEGEHGTKKEKIAVRNGTENGNVKVDRISGVISKAKSMGRLFGNQSPSG